MESASHAARAPWLDGSRGAFIIAEIGKNFITTEEEQPVPEMLAQAIALVRAAKDAGADAVKFQTHVVADEQRDVHIISPHFRGADRYRWVARNERATPYEDFWKPLAAACANFGIAFFTTSMSRAAAQKIAPLHPPFWKVGSGDVLDFVLLDTLAATGKPIILSTGMSTMEEVDTAIAFLRTRGVEDLAILHCVSRYPCPPHALRLGTMETLHERYGVPVGFSDHSIGIDEAVAAVALGAYIVEKHFSFDRLAWGSDHKVSLTPTEFAALVRGIREVERHPAARADAVARAEASGAIGDSAKILQEDEAVFRPYFRKVLVAARDIPAAVPIIPAMLSAMRPLADGALPSERYEDVLGARAVEDIPRGTPLEARHLIVFHDAVPMVHGAS